MISMIKRPLLLRITIFFTGQMFFAQAQTPKLDNAKFSAETVKNTIDDLQHELSAKHPGFYRYTKKTEFDVYIDLVKARSKTQ